MLHRSAAASVALVAGLLPLSVGAQVTPEGAESLFCLGGQALPGGVPSEPSATPYDVAPQLVNEPEVQAMLEVEWPRILRAAGVGGTTPVHFFVGDEGRVLNVVTAESSGHVELDRAALRVACVFRFSPALRGGETVAVWLRIPITFGTP